MGPPGFCRVYGSYGARVSWTYDTSAITRRDAGAEAEGRGGNGASAAKRRRVDPDVPRSNGHHGDVPAEHLGSEQRRERRGDADRDDRRDGGDRGGGERHGDRRRRHDFEHENGHAQPSERQRGGDGHAEGRQPAAEAQHRGRGRVKADLRSRLGPVALGRGAPVEDGISALKDGTLPLGTASPEAPVELPADDDRWDMDA